MATTTDRQAELDRLIQQQAADDTDRLPYRGAIQASQLDTPTGLDWTFDQFADPEALAPLERLILCEKAGPVVLAFYDQPIGGGLVWDASVVSYDGKADCPACEGVTLKGRASCLVCSRSADNDHRHPMVGTPTRPTRAKRSKSGKVLAGGTGKATAKPKTTAKVKPTAKRRKNPWSDFVASGWA